MGYEPVTFNTVQLNQLIRYGLITSKDFKNNFSIKNYQVQYCTRIECATCSGIQLMTLGINFLLLHLHIRHIHRAMHLLFDIVPWYLAGRFYIADTNNSVIRYIDLNKQEPELLTLELKGVRPPAPKSRSPKRLRRRSGADTEIIVVDGGSSNEGNLNLKISVSEGYHFSKVLSWPLSLSICFNRSCLSCLLWGCFWWA